MANRLKTLILEDESLVGMQIAQAISSFGYEVVDYVTETASVKNLLETKQIDLLLMDINLGGAQDSIDFYMQEKLTLPVVYITAYSDEETITKAIRTNPLGYLLKPLNEAELKALLKLVEYKIHAIPQQHSSENLELGYGYSFDSKSRKLFYNDIHINLGTKELMLLEILLDANGQSVSYETLESRLYENKTSASSLRTLIYRLRSKLEYKLIHNEFNYGIKLVRN